MKIVFQQKLPAAEVQIGLFHVQTCDVDEGICGEEGICAFDGIGGRLEGSDV